MLVKLRNRQARIEDIGNQHCAIQSLHHPAQHRRFPRTDFAGHDDQASSAFDAVVKIGHHFGMRGREIDVARIGRQREGQFFQSVEFGVHVSSSFTGYAGILPALWNRAFVGTLEACVRSLGQKLLEHVCQSQHERE